MIMRGEDRKAPYWPCRGRGSRGEGPENGPFLVLHQRSLALIWLSKDHAAWPRVPSRSNEDVYESDGSP